MTPYLYACQINKSWMPHATLISTRQQRLVVVALCRMVLFKNNIGSYSTHFKIVSKAHLIENVHRRKVSIDRLPSANLSSVVKTTNKMCFLTFN